MQFQRIRIITIITLKISLIVEKNNNLVYKFVHICIVTRIYFISFTDYVVKNVHLDIIIRRFIYIFLY